jgi:hypothetical protein
VDGGQQATARARAARGRGKRKEGRGGRSFKLGSLAHAAPVEQVRPGAEPAVATTARGSHGTAPAGGVGRRGRGDARAVSGRPSACILNGRAEVSVSD